MDEEPLLGARTFCAASHPSDKCGSNGLPLTPNGIRICGRFQRLTTLKHSALCEYVAIVRGRHERLFVVTEHHARSLNDALVPEDALISLASAATENSLSRLAANLLGALSYLNDNGVVHRNLSPSNILFDPVGNIKLSDYGLCYMTNGGSEVEFPIGNPRYIAPELLCLPPVLPAREVHPCPRADVWSLGVILLEQLVGLRAWTRFGEDVDAVLQRVRAAWELATPRAPVTRDAGDSLIDFGESRECDTSAYDGVTAATADATNALEFLLAEFRSDAALHTMSPQFVSFLSQCLRVSPSGRPTPCQLLSHPFIVAHRTNADVPSTVSWTPSASNSRPFAVGGGLSASDGRGGGDPLLGRSLAENYHLWTLAGGDVAAEMTRRGLVQSRPPVLHIPILARVDGSTHGGTRDRTQMYDPAVLTLSLRQVRDRLQSAAAALDLSPSYGDYERALAECGDDRPPAKGEFVAPPTIHSGRSSDVHLPDAEGSLDNHAHFHLREAITSPITSATVAADIDNAANGNFSEISVGSSLGNNTDLAAATRAPLLPLPIRERDIEYQMQRLSLFNRLLECYPHSRRRVCVEAAVDIPPHLRGRLWGAILGVRGDYVAEYIACDKESETPTDRQIDVDIPRCHQYEQLLASPEGHAKFRRILKAWVQSNPELAYWQGLDSLCAPFLALNFNDEARAYACLSVFVRRYLPGFFAHDNSATIQDYLASFRHLLAFGDPELAAHLDEIGFLPELYAIPWFLTMYTHVFPLSKIYHLWDSLLLGPPSFPLCIGASILRQLRESLLSYQFNECILMFSDMPDINIERCTRDAFRLSAETPPSITRRPKHDEGRGADQDGRSTNDGLGDQWWSAPAPLDVLKRELAPRISPDDAALVSGAAFFIDVRPDEDFRRSHIAYSVNANPGYLKRVGPRLRQARGSYVVVVAAKGDTGPKVAERFVRAHYAKVALLHGGADALAAHRPAMMCSCTCRVWDSMAGGVAVAGSQAATAAPVEFIECAQRPIYIRQGQGDSSGR
eukprot:Opistho-2@44615